MVPSPETGSNLRRFERVCFSRCLICSYPQDVLRYVCRLKILKKSGSLLHILKWASQVVESTLCNDAIRGYQEDMSTHRINVCYIYIYT